MTATQVKTRRRSLPAYTLVEVLVAIAIIGILAALLVVAVQRVMAYARQARLSAEVSMLELALESYKHDKAGYPPDFGTLANNQPGWSQRQAKIMVHVRRAYPQFVTLNYTAFRAGVVQAFQNAANLTPPLVFGNTAPNGNSQPGDLDNLDSGEALVFWLGGLPSPGVQDPATGQYRFSLLGTSADRKNPFVFGSARDRGAFAFDESRLADADGDGWPEYYPPTGELPQPPGSGAAPVAPVAPYVYFSSTTYTSIANYDPNNVNGYAFYPAHYPLYQNTGTAPMPQSLQQLWGFAVPYVSQFVAHGNATQIEWIDPEKYQIVCTGPDGVYWRDPTGALSLNSFRLYPALTNFSLGDLDNLTSFEAGRLGDTQP
ncbi:MAG TPA: prepilin-type N-terminal cleavage/methylation domain-containing protein [Pirellulales bacterium]|jgi:prepilin-type N-terminal cleavage/methylation domain-containing protein|nr:prepilin-type N-terminal cleavage/methylation domain-containing protein [Pirellulales bacterium]